MIITNIKIKVTQEQKKLIIKLAKAYKMTVNEFINYVLLKFVEKYENRNTKGD